MNYDEISLKNNLHQQINIFEIEVIDFNLNFTRIENWKEVK